MEKSVDISNALTHKKVYIDQGRGFALISYYKDPLSCLRFDYSILADKNPTVIEYRKKHPSDRGEPLIQELKPEYCTHIMMGVYIKMGESFEPYEATAVIRSYELHFKKKRRSLDIVDLIFPQLPTVLVTVEDVIDEIIGIGELYFSITKDDLKAAVDSIKKNLV